MAYRKRHIKKKIHSIRPRKNILTRLIFWIVILVLIITSAAVYLVLFFSKIQVDRILISGNQKVSAVLVESIIKNYAEKKFGFGIGSKSIFLADTGEMYKRIMAEFPAIKTASVSKNFPDLISVKIEERKPAAVFCTADAKCLDIDEAGVIFEEAQMVGQNNLIVRQNSEPGSIQLGKSIVEPGKMSAILKIQKDLKDNFQIDAREAVVFDSGRLDLATGEGWKIYFDLSNLNVDMQITKMNLLLNGEIAEAARKNLHYIDLRFKDRAYYK